MNLDPTLNKFDRIAYLAGGPGMVAHAFLGGVDEIPVQVLFVALGVMFAINGVGVRDCFASCSVRAAN